MKVKRFLKKVGSLEISYLPQAPDHGWPEIAVIVGKRVTPVAVGSEATVLWQHPLDEAGFRALLKERNASEEKLVSA
jgi:hypothetical protein